MTAPDAPSLPPCLACLAQAEHVTLGPTGVAATVLPEAAAYEEAQRLGGELHDALLWMAGHATVAGRMYAALLLGPVDKRAADETWRALLAVHEWVTVAPGGCNVMSAWASDFAQSALERSTLWAYRESPEQKALRDQRALERGRRSVTGIDKLTAYWAALTQGPFVVLIPIVSVLGLIAFGYLLQWLNE